MGPVGDRIKLSYQLQEKNYMFYLTVEIGRSNDVEAKN